MQAALIGPSGQTILGPAGLTIGRMQSNQYVVYDRRVSACHAEIHFLKQGYFTITDIGSTNGTLVNGLLLTHNVAHKLQAGDTICIGDTVLTFLISDQFHDLPNDIPPRNESSQAWENSATDRLARVRYRPAHRKILISVLLVSIMLMGVITLGSFEYLNRSTPDGTLDNFCKALHSKDYQSIYEQLSYKLQGLGSEKMIAENLSNIKYCTYKIIRASGDLAVAKLTFTGLSGQIVSGTMTLSKDSNNTWKIEDLQNI